MDYENREYKYNKESKEFEINCCDWKSIIEICDEEPIAVVVNFRVYRLLDKTIRFKDLYNMTQDHRYHEVCLPADLLGVSLSCSKCSGSGTLDWVQKTTSKRSLMISPNKRDPYARTLKFKVPMDLNPHLTHPFSPTFITKAKNRRSFQYVYTSYPHLTDEEEYCPRCSGSGLRELSHPKVVLVETIKGVKIK